MTHRYCRIQWLKASHSAYIYFLIELILNCKKPFGFNRQFKYTNHLHLPLTCRFLDGAVHSDRNRFLFKKLTIPTWKNIHFLDIPLNYLTLVIYCCLLMLLLNNPAHFYQRLATTKKLGRQNDINANYAALKLMFASELIKPSYNPVI